MLSAIVSVVAVPSPMPEVVADASVDAPSRDGTFTLNWSIPTEAADQEFEVQIDPSGTGEAYEHWYRGPATQSFLSGLTDGTVLVRARARTPEGPWSKWCEPIRVPVEHHPMNEALTLFGLGFVVFALIAGYLSYMTFRTGEAVE